MNIEITEAMQKEIVKQATDRLINMIVLKTDIKDIMGKARAEAVSILASKAAGEFHKKMNVDVIVSNAITDTENRINARIKKILKKGIKIKLSE